MGGKAVRIGNLDIEQAVEPVAPLVAQESPSARRAETAAADSNRATRIVLDLRWNNGGDNTLLRPLITGIIARPQFDRRDAFYVLIGRHTFFAAQNLVTLLENLTNVSLVGELSGAPPNHYGDAARYRLPNSGHHGPRVHLAEAGCLPRDRRTAVAPHIAAPTTLRDYQSGRDPAVEAALGRR